MKKTNAKKTTASAKKSVKAKKPAVKKVASKKVVAKASTKAKTKVTAKAAVKAKAKVKGKVVAKIKAAAPKAKAAAKPAAAKKHIPTSNERVGILGGAFNPIHFGHLNSALTVRDRLQLDKVILLPNGNPPHRQIIGPGKEERFEMVEAAVKRYSPELEASRLELDREGINYTFETLKELSKTYHPENMFFIMGADAFAHFPQWKNFEELLGLANFVVTTRPGSESSFGIHEHPIEIAEHIKKSMTDELVLNTKRSIYFVDLEDKDISATEVRRQLRNNHTTRDWLPESVLEIINTKSLYKRSSPLVADYRDFALYCADKASDKKALGLKAYDMTKQSSYADYSVICSATSNRHAASIAHGIIDSAKEEYGLSPLSVEGLNEGLWVLVDFGSVVVHVFQDHVRNQYRIEDLWKGCPQFENELKASSRTGETQGHSAEVRPKS